MDVEALNLREHAAGVILPVKAVPGASRDRVAGVLGDVLKVSTATAPEKGKANKAIAKTLAKALGCAANQIEILSGPTQPRKTFLIRGFSPKQLRAALAGVR